MQSPQWTHRGISGDLPPLVQDGAFVLRAGEVVAMLAVGRTHRYSAPFQVARLMGRVRSSPLWLCRRSSFH
jgi:hypothetical protein